MNPEPPVYRPGWTDRVFGFWTPRRRVWKAIHHFVNGLAWRFAAPPGPKFGRGLRIDKKHPLWRLNDWVSDRWTTDWIGWRVAQSRKQP